MIAGFAAIAASRSAAASRATGSGHLVCPVSDTARSPRNAEDRNDPAALLLTCRWVFGLGGPYQPLEDFTIHQQPNSSTAPKVMLSSVQVTGRVVGDDGGGGGVESSGKRSAPGYVIRPPSRSRAAASWSRQTPSRSPSGPTPWCRWR